MIALTEVNLLIRSVDTFDASLFLAIDVYCYKTKLEVKVITEI